MSMADRYAVMALAVLAGALAGVAVALAGFGSAALDRYVPVAMWICGGVLLFNEAVAVPLLRRRQRQAGKDAA